MAVTSGKISPAKYSPSPDPFYRSKETIRGSPPTLVKDEPVNLQSHNK